MKNTLYLLLLAPGVALANDAALLKCRALTDIGARVACYDAIPAGGSAARSLPAEDFGMRPAPVKKSELPASIQSTVVGDFDGWVRGTQITLANGQTWRVNDDSEAVLPPMRSPKVEISRGLLGSYLFQVAGHTNTARVVRVK